MSVMAMKMTQQATIGHVDKTLNAPSSGTDSGRESIATKQCSFTFVTEHVDTTAATDNRVSVQLFGSEGETDEVDLFFTGKQAMPAEKQEGTVKKQTLDVELKNIGNVKHCKFTHINCGNGVYKWYLGSIELKVEGEEDPIKFRYNQWIQQNSGILTVQLTPRPVNPVDDSVISFVGSDNGSMEYTLRNIDTLKKNLEVGSAAYNVLCRAQEILDSAEFLAKKEKSREYLLSVNMLDEFFEQRMEEMAIDIAEREDERTDDLLQYERAGLPAEEQAKIPKLDETNNPCYKYLREHGNMWQYDPSKIDNRMRGRLYRRFDTFDKDQDGVMTLDEIATWADRMRSVCQTDDEEIESVRDALRCYFTMYGMAGNGVCRENWVETHVTMGAATIEKAKNKEPLPMVFLANTYFDVIDEDDNGILSLQELKNMMNVFRVPEEAAYTFFEYADTDRNGELDKEEMHKLFYRFWFEEYDSEVDAIFAYKY